MDSGKQIAFDVRDKGFLPLIKKDASRLAVQCGLSPKRIAEIDIVISEIGTNLIKHAGGGEIIIRCMNDPLANGLEIISVDSGPGMADPGRMMEDGISTKGTLGQGLGAVRRLSDQMQVYSVPEWGTILLSRIFESDHQQIRPSKISVSPIVLAKAGEIQCGDAYAWKSNPYFVKVMLADGLGHGALANEASQKAAQAFNKSVYNTPHQILLDIHQNVKNTRGLVATVAVYDLTNKYWLISGVGNISTRLQDAISSKTYLPYNGIVGVNIPKRLESQTIRPEPGRNLVLCSDGISSRWDLSKHTAAFRYDQSILSAVIYKEFARHSDDTSVVIVKV